MAHLRVPALLLLLLVLLRCVSAAPNRFFSPSSSGEEEEERAVPGAGGGLGPALSHALLGLGGLRPRRGPAAVTGRRVQKRKCNTATCVTQRLADFLVRSSGGAGAAYAPTNVGSDTYGRRALPGDLAL